MFSICIPNSLILTEYTLTEVSINGVVRTIDLSYDSASLQNIPGLNASVQLSPNYLDSEGLRLMFNFRNQPLAQDVEIHFTFKSNYDAAYTPIVSYSLAALADSVNATWIEDTTAGSRWKLTMAEGCGYALDFIQLEQDAQTKVTSEDGVSIEWVVTEDGAAYTAVLQPITVSLGELYLNSTSGRDETGHWNGVGANRTVFEGQRVALILGRSFNYSNRAIQNEVTYKFYAGTDTNATPLKVLVSSINSETDNGKEYEDNLSAYVILDPMPALDKITVTAQVADGEIVSKTYDVNIPSSGETKMTWLSVPSSGPYPTESKTAISGPNVYGSAAFRNAETGEISLYLAVSGGVMKYTTTGTTSLVYMDGMSFGYYDNEDASGHAIALGGASESDLTALVKKVTGSYTAGLNTSYCLYRYSGGTWQEVSGSALSTPHSFGLVLASNNVWVSDQHWNGTSWVSNDVTFNSFWKNTDGTAYAGSSSGIYKYSKGTWTVVSGVTGTAYISSGCRNPDGSVTLILSEKMEIEGANQWYMEQYMASLRHESMIYRNLLAIEGPISTSTKTARGSIRKSMRSTTRRTRPTSQPGNSSAPLRHRSSSRTASVTLRIPLKV